jgi:hypothetical protein
MYSHKGAGVCLVQSIDVLFKTFHRFCCYDNSAYNKQTEISFSLIYWSTGEKYCSNVSREENNRDCISNTEGKIQTSFLPLYERADWCSGNAIDLYYDNSGF